MLSRVFQREHDRYQALSYGKGIEPDAISGPSSSRRSNRLQWPIWSFANNQPSPSPHLSTQPGALREYP
jgi:hypothetical protein